MNPILPSMPIASSNFATGVFVFSAQVLVYAYVTQAFPDRIRGSALGITAGIGRLGGIVGPLITGILVSTGQAYPWGFYFFALAAGLGVVAMAAAPRLSPVPATVGYRARDGDGDHADEPGGERDRGRR